MLDRYIFKNLVIVSRRSLIFGMVGVIQVLVDLYPEENHNFNC